MKKYLILIMMLFLAGANLSCNSQESHHEGRHHGTAEGSDLKLSGSIESGVRIIDVRASRYKFEPNPIVVKSGDKVRLIVTSADTAHGLAISKFKVDVRVSAGKTESVEFLADKKGAFPVHCSVYCGSGHGNMHATFIVIK